MQSAERPNNQIRKSSGRGYDPRKFRRPFWLPASNYYVLAIAVTIAFFFLVWGILHEGKEDDAPWIPAGISASVVLIGAVILREGILRKARNRYLSAQKKLDHNLNNIALHSRANQNANKLSIEKNAAIIKEIEKKSEAARILGKLPEGHLEVFEMCDEYLRINKKELETVGVGSPRLAALRRGREKVQNLHRFHLLVWAEIESRGLTLEAKNRVTMSEKLEMAQKALTVLDSALQFYPGETTLAESADALTGFVASIKISHWIEQAERSAFKGNYKRAISHYRDALFFLARENIQNEEKEIIAEKINSEITKLREITEKNTTKSKNRNLENG
jgi:tetratricopeptide (TPR) repeat protein